MHTPSYVHLNGFGVYYFRMALPRQLKAILGKHEIRRSLKTTNYNFAVKKARRLAVFTESLFLSNNIPSKKELLQALNQGFRLLTKESANINQALIIPEDRHTTLPTHEVAPVVTVPPKVPIQLTNYQINLSPPAPQLQPVLPEPNSMLLSELIEKYVQCQMDENSWQPKTREENLAIFEILQRVVGDPPLSTLDHESVDRFRAILKKLPREPSLLLDTDPIPQIFADFEKRQLLRCYFDLLAGLRISTSIAFIFTDLETAKTAQLDPAPLRQSIDHRSDDGIDNGFGVLQGQVHLVGQSLDQIRFCHDGVIGMNLLML